MKAEQQQTEPWKLNSMKQTWNMKSSRHQLTSFTATFLLL